MSAGTAVLSDIHGNSPALEAVLADVDRLGCARLFFLGDIVGGADAHRCIELLQNWGRSTGHELFCIQGNAEAYTLTPHLESLPGREETKNRDLVQLITWIRAHLTPEDRDWLESHPEVRFMEGACLAHDSPLDRLFPERWHRPGLEEAYQEWFYHARGIVRNLDGSALEELLTWMDTRGVTRVYCGHTHDPFVRQIGGRLICNAGAVGFALDGDPRSSWVLVDGEVAIRRVAYDVDRILRLTEDNGYLHHADPARRRAYSKMLQTGIHWRFHL
jgi:predicted phosphodiesterase